MLNASTLCPMAYYLASLARHCASLPAVRRRKAAHLPKGGTNRTCARRASVLCRPSQTSRHVRLVRRHLSCYAVQVPRAACPALLTLTPCVLAPSLERWQGEVEAQRALDSARLLWARFVARNRSDLVRCGAPSARSCSSKSRRRAS